MFSVKIVKLCCVAELVEALHSVHSLVHIDWSGLF